MNIKLRLKKARAYAGLTQTELANKAKVDQAIISNIERGIAAGSKKLPEIAVACGVRVDWLTMGTGSMIEGEGNIETSNFSPTKKAPLISWVMAGEWKDANEHDAEEWIEVSTTDNNVFWLRVVGDSMTSSHGISAPNGSLIKVDPERIAENGSLVIAKLEDSQEATFKKLVIDAGRKYLMPLNSAYPPMQVNGNCTIVGVVTEIRIKLT